MNWDLGTRNPLIAVTKSAAFGESSCPVAAGAGSDYLKAQRKLKNGLLSSESHRGGKNPIREQIRVTRHPSRAYISSPKPIQKMW
jgi:hypothetical protein